MRNIVFVVSLLFSSLCSAESLTGSDVEKWMETFRDVQAWSRQQDGTKATFKQKQLDYSAIFSSAIEQSKSEKHYDSLAKVIKQHGFDPMQWAQMGDRIMVAVAANQMSDFEVKELEEHVKHSEAMLNTSEMSAAQKAVLQDMMQSTKDALAAAAAAPEEDKAAVKPYQDQLTKLIDQ